MNLCLFVIANVLKSLNFEFVSRIWRSFSLGVCQFRSLEVADEKPPSLKSKLLSIKHLKRKVWSCATNCWKVFDGFFLIQLKPGQDYRKVFDSYWSLVKTVVNPSHQKGGSFLILIISIDQKNFSNLDEGLLQNSGLLLNSNFCYFFLVVLQLKKL